VSIESAKAFLERVENDEDFRKELEGKTSVEERIKFAKTQGFDFTKDEIRELTDSLSDEQLDAVAAGGWNEVGCVATGVLGLGFPWKDFPTKL
jgi:predicted ribosomally synthesized peptide with nif11-like leader